MIRVSKVGTVATVICAVLMALGIILMDSISPSDAGWILFFKLSGGIMAFGLSAVSGIIAVDAYFD